MSPSAQTAQMVVVCGQNKTEKEKGMSGSGRKRRSKGPESLIEKERAWRRPGRGLVGSLYSRSDMRPLRLLMEMSPTSNSCEANYIRNGSWPTSFWQAVHGLFLHFRLPRSDALLALYSAATKRLRVSLGWPVFFFFSSLFKTFKSNFCRFSPAISSLNIFLGQTFILVAITCLLVMSCMLTNGNSIC